MDLDLNGDVDETAAIASRSPLMIGTHVVIDGDTPQRIQI
jgi:hypothetical protein